jgi:hypothetical protein
LCIINSDKNILLWETYDILDDDNMYCNICGRSAKYNLDNTLYCGIHFKGDKKIKKNHVKKKKVSQYSLQDIACKIILKINIILSENLEIFNQITSAILELQPSINPKMKFVSHILYGKLCEIFMENDCTVSFERASQKLKKYKGNKGDFVKNTYNNRKLKAIEYVKSILDSGELKNGIEYLEYFNNMKRQHDASDSMLIAYNKLT